jgi:resolvase-like protein
VRKGDTLVVTKLDRLARSVPDARAIGDDLAGRGIKLSLGGQIYDPADPMGKMFFSILSVFAEFEVDLLRLRTKEGMAVARAKGSSAGDNPNSRPSNSASFARCTAPASTPSPISPRCSPSPGPRCTGHCAGRPQPNGTDLSRAAPAPGPSHPLVFRHLDLEADDGLACAALLRRNYERDVCRAGLSPSHVRELR